MNGKQQKVIIDKVGSDGNIVRIKLSEDISQSGEVAYLSAALDKCIKHGFDRIILDLQNIKSACNDFVAQVIEATAKVRRHKGDIKIINLSEETRENMAAFNAYVYLSIESEE